MEMGEWKDNAAVEKLLFIMHICLVVLGVAVIGILAVETILRLLGVGWSGYEDPLTMAVFWLYMMGAAYAAYGGRYPEHDILGSVLKPGRAADTVTLIQRILILVIGLLLCWWSIKLCIHSVQQGSATVAYGWPMIIGYASMAAGLFLSALFQLLHLIDFVRFYVGAYIRKEAAE